MNYVAVLFFLFSQALLSQDRPVKQWVYFTDKENPSVRSSIRQIPERTLRRREERGTAVTDDYDIPVSSYYIDQLQKHHIVIQNCSRWFNAVTAYLTPDQKTELEKLPFVKSISPVRTFLAKELPPADDEPKGSFQKSAANQRFNYGPSLAQMEMINAVAVHNIRISGRGVFVGMLDNGFRWKNHEALQNLNVMAEYDFIQHDSVTENQEGDVSSQDSHGTSTFSLVGGFKEGELVSPAYNATFFLGKTEDNRSETPAEEDNWVAGIEWMEWNGVDVVSSSLGYNEFDAPDNIYNYTYADLNGRTATTTKAAAIAARKGVVVVNAMGNEGNNAWHYMITPADADSIISVGAVNGSGAYASFSSVGPTSDGRIKPDVAAHGVGTFCAVPTGKISAYSNSLQGTSLATPLVAGVAAMILSAHPGLTPVQVRDALRNTASNAATPNNTIGWGIINAYKAVLYDGMVISTDPEITVTTDSNYSIGMYVVSDHQIVQDSVRLHYSIDNGTSFSSLPMTLTETVDSSTASGKYSAVIPVTINGVNIQFYVEADDTSPLRSTSPANAPLVLYSAKTGATGIETTPRIPRMFVLGQNFPNPFNPATTIRYQIPVADEVSLTVYDLLGKKIATLVEGVQTAGVHTVRFYAERLSTGVYFYRLRTSSFAETKKMVLIK